ncbi:MAG: glycosyltransferase [Actinomycetota bacterium]|nr:glycosyltransferase [Actinomycetota bacterium]
MATPECVSVVIPARNAASVIVSQLEGLARQCYEGAWEVIVADNGSTDATVAVALSWSDRLPALRVVPASGRKGVNHARNIGAAAAAGDFLVFCDADDVATPGWLLAMTEAAATADLVGGYPDHEALNSPQARCWRPVVRRDALPSVFGFLPYAVGASLGVWSEVFRQLGGFNEDYARGGDDVEFSWRAQLASFSLGHAPGAVMSYRLRERPWPLAKQGYGYGYSDAHLYRDFRRSGLPALPPGHGLRSWGQLARRLPELGRRQTAGAWVYGAAWRVGRLAGSARYRVICL